jgi:uncharacterized protein (TIGR02147 family)
MSKESISKPEALFECENYRQYVVGRIKAMPKRGRGEFQRIALRLQMHTTLVSQVFRGQKSLTFEQACGLCDHLGLNALETDYFMKLIEFDRAGSDLLRRLVRRQLADIRARAREVSSRVPRGKAISESERAIFYSTWHYSAVRLLTSIPRFQMLDPISEHLGLSKKQVREILDFLVRTGLCTELHSKFSMSEKNTHVEAQSPFVVRHHLNWRMKALQKVESLSPRELAFTAPVSISEKDFAKVREILLDAIQRIGKIVEQSPAEEVGFLTLDWMKI